MLPNSSSIEKTLTFGEKLDSFFIFFKNEDSDKFFNINYFEIFGNIFIKELLFYFLNFNKNYFNFFFLNKKSYFHNLFNNIFPFDKEDPSNELKNSIDEFVRVKINPKSLSECSLDKYLLIYLLIFYFICSKYYSYKIFA